MLCKGLPLLEIDRCQGMQPSEMMIPEIKFRMILRRDLSKYCGLRGMYSDKIIGVIFRDYPISLQDRLDKAGPFPTNRCIHRGSRTSLGIPPWPRLNTYGYATRKYYVDGRRQAGHCRPGEMLAQRGNLQRLEKHEMGSVTLPGRESICGYRYPFLWFERHR